MQQWLGLFSSSLTIQGRIVAVALACSIPLASILCLGASFAQDIPTPDSPSLIDTRSKPSVVDILKRQQEARQRAAQKQAQATDQKKETSASRKSRKSARAVKAGLSEPVKQNEISEKAVPDHTQINQKPILPGRIGLEGALESWKPTEDLEPMKLTLSSPPGNAMPEEVSFNNRIPLESGSSLPTQSAPRESNGAPTLTQNSLPSETEPSALKKK